MHPSWIGSAFQRFHQLILRLAPVFERFHVEQTLQHDDSEIVDVHL